MRTLVGVVGSLVALVGFSGAANASATVDLLWFTNGFTSSTAMQLTDAATTVFSTPATSQTLTVGIYVTNTNTADPCPNAGSIMGPCRLQVLALSIDASSMLKSGKWSVLDFQGPGTGDLPNQFGRLGTVTGFTNCPQTVGYYSYPCLGWNTNHFSAASSPLPPFQNGNLIQNFNIFHTDVAKGLPAAFGRFLLGVIQFHKDTGPDADVGVLTAVITSTDAILETGLVVPNSDIVFNDATVVNVPEPGSLSLLVLAVGGLMAAGRRLRS